jgi:NAD-dependent dihydropyrimidine dehydrogenase PreA subunit
MKRFDFGLKHRLDMFLSMNFPVYAVPALALALFWPQYVLGYSILFWSAVAVLYLFLDVIPGKTGWGQSFLCAAVLVAAWMASDWLLHGDPFVHGGWLVSSFVIFFAAGFDLAGTVSPRKSDAEQFVHGLGLKSLGSLLSERDLGEITLDRVQCNGCRACLDICPVGVYADLDAEKKITFRDQHACFACNACVKQCPEDALSLA